MSQQNQIKWGTKSIGLVRWYNDLLKQRFFNPFIFNMLYFFKYEEKFELNYNLSE
jgi:hypothetical protein